MCVTTVSFFYLTSIHTISVYPSLFYYNFYMIKPSFNRLYVLYLLVTLQPIIWSHVHCCRIQSSNIPTRELIWSSYIRKFYCITNMGYYLFPFDLFVHHLRRHYVHVYKAPSSNLGNRVFCYYLQLNFSRN